MIFSLLFRNEFSEGNKLRWTRNGYEEGTSIGNKTIKSFIFNSKGAGIRTILLSFTCMPTFLFANARTIRNVTYVVVKIAKPNLELLSIVKENKILKYLYFVIVTKSAYVSRTREQRLNTIV